MAESHESHSMAWPVSSQPLIIDFSAGTLVQDAGLLVVRHLDVSLGVLSDLAARLPDPRSPRYIQHSLESLLVQFVNQFLAGYPDGNDADHTRTDSLFQILLGFAPDPNYPLASASTLNRFLYGYTRRDAQLPREDRPSLLQERRAQIQRLRACNDFLLDLFIRTRGKPPQQIVLDLDATDDPVHGHQPLSAYHGYYRQHQYLPLLLFEGNSGFPLACWLRPGTLHAADGAVDVLRQVVETDYQSGSWTKPRRMVVKVEVTPAGSQRRFVVTNLGEPAREVYRDFYVQRGAVPEQPIGQLKNGLSADRLSSGGFCANALKMLVAVVAYALVALYREACSGIEEVKNADIETLRNRLWKVPGEVHKEAKRVRVSLPGDWQGGPVWRETLKAVGQYAGQLQQVGEPPGPAQQAT